MYREKGEIREAREGDGGKREIRKRRWRKGMKRWKEGKGGI